eukprot:TRINITY_DN2248_c0_g5_i2.p3 TRINITY_DN2248_c0_g5~~TRINITY_DN2248_c0_g5_i2.p3  ORF type:complete len:143 (+),score=1.76 TRINITY_DN2248_c0_g5_i2:368-796(+)
MPESQICTFLYPSTTPSQGYGQNLLYPLPYSTLLKVFFGMYFKVLPQLPNAHAHSNAMLLMRTIETLQILHYSKNASKYSQVIIRVNQNTIFSQKVFIKQFISTKLISTSTLYFFDCQKLVCPYSKKKRELYWEQQVMLKGE